MMKKKVLSIALVVALIAIVVSGSLAYFTDNDAVTNTFTIGSVEIEIHENGALVEGDTLDMDDVLLPVVGSDPEVATDNYGQKQVTVKNTGKNDAYVQVFVAVPKVLDDAGVLKFIKNYHPDSESYNWVGGDTVVDTMTDNDGIVCNIYKFVYTKLLEDGATTDSEAIEYVYLTSATDLNVTRDAQGNVTTAYLVDASGNELTAVNVKDGIPVYVYAQAVQADGFSDYSQALTSGFGADENPWA